MLVLDAKSGLERVVVLAGSAFHLGNARIAGEDAERIWQRRRVPSNSASYSLAIDEIVERQCVDGVADRTDSIPPSPRTESRRRSPGNNLLLDAEAVLRRCRVRIVERQVLSALRMVAVGGPGGAVTPLDGGGRRRKFDVVHRWMEGKQAGWLLRRRCRDALHALSRTCRRLPRRTVLPFPVEIERKAHTRLEQSDSCC